MRRSLEILFSLSLVAASAAQALAQVNVIHQPDQARFRSLTVINFGEVSVEGETAKPGLSFQLTPQKTRFASLVRLRVDFNDELRRSSDNL